MLHEIFDRIARTSAAALQTAEGLSSSPGTDVRGKVDGEEKLATSSSKRTTLQLR